MKKEASAKLDIDIGVARGAVHLFRTCSVGCALWAVGMMLFTPSSQPAIAVVTEVGLVAALNWLLLALYRRIYDRKKVA